MNDYGVVMPAFDAEETIGEALASVLAQTVAPREIVVVDDGSRDGTIDAVRAAAPSARVVRQENAGPGAATSRGVRLLSSPIVATIDADDIWLPAKMERQLAFLEEHPDVAMVACHMRQFRHEEGDDGRGEVRPSPNRSTSVFRRDAFLRVGDIYDPPGGRGDMIDWLARFREHGFRDAILGDVLALRRIISTSMSHGRDPAKDRGYLDVARRAILRRRAAEKGEG